MENFTQFNFDSNICKAITLCGYEKPTPVQTKSIPEVLTGRDVVVSAQTGTGKTAAFVLPILQLLSLKEPTKKTRVLILTPTRELAAQITKAAAVYGKFMRFNIISLVGGVPYHNQIRDLARGADIIVATPGRLMDHIEQKRVDLSSIEMLVLDEADRMLDMGFIDDVQYIAKLTPSHRQTLLFSATLDNKLMNAVKHLLKDPARIDLSHERISSPQIKEEMYKVNNLHHKTRLLKHFLADENIYKAIIFSATKSHADKLADELCDDGFKAAALHGDLRQNVRTRTLEQLRRGKIQYLVATDVAARGIDISDITHVFNYDLPRFCEDYVHRIGRTGRAGKTGTAISFVGANDMQHLKSIERYTGQRLQLQHHDVKEIRSFDSAEMPKRAHLDDEDDDGEGRSGRGFRPERRERSFRSESGGRFERKFSGSERSERSERPERSERSDRPARSFERSDRSERSSERSDRPERSSERSGERSESPYKSRSKQRYSSDTQERSERKPKSDRYEKSDRPFRKETSRDDRGDRSERRTSFSRDERRPERSERSERSDRPERSERTERSERSDRPDRPFKKKFRSDGDRPEGRGDRNRDERPERSFRKKTGARFEKKFGDDKRESSSRHEPIDRSERKFHSGKKQDEVKVEFREGYRAKSKTSSSQKPRRSFDEPRREKSGGDFGFKKKRRK